MPISSYNSENHRRDCVNVPIYSKLPINDKYYSHKICCCGRTREQSSADHWLSPTINDGFVRKGLKSSNKSCSKLLGREEAVMIW